MPEATDLESTQLIQDWWHQIRRAVLAASRRRPAAAGGRAAGRRARFHLDLHRARATNGLIEAYNAAINRGAAGVPLKGANHDFSLDAGRVHSVEAIWDAVCKAATAQFSDGAEVKDLAWFKEHGFFVVPFKRADWYLYPTMVDKDLRFELPYQERLLRPARNCANRLHEHDIHWWDDQLDEYAPLPVWHDVPGRWERAVRKMGGNPADYPLWLITTKSMQYSAGNNAGIPLMDEVGQNMRGHGGVIINVATRKRFGIGRTIWSRFVPSSAARAGAPC